MQNKKFNFCSFFIQIYVVITNPLINRADRTGTQPDFNTGRVYLLYKTTIIQQGNRIKYMEMIMNDSQLYATAENIFRLKFCNKVHNSHYFELLT